GEEGAKGGNVFVIRARYHTTALPAWGRPTASVACAAGAGHPGSSVPVAVPGTPAIAAAARALRLGLHRYLDGGLLALRPERRPQMGLGGTRHRGHRLEDFHRRRGGTDRQPVPINDIA